MKKEEQILKDLRKIEEFKGISLSLRLNEISNSYIVKGYEDDETYHNLYNAALRIKKASAQINEMVHAFGILSCLPRILQKNEQIESLSLASGAAGDGIDLVTSHRVAEFKFSNWQETASNGMRRRQVFSDLVSLYLNETKKQKELYVLDIDAIKDFFTGHSKWKKVLSKNELLRNRLIERCDKDLIEGEYVRDIFTIANVELIDINILLQ